MFHVKHDPGFSFVKMFHVKHFTGFLFGDVSRETYFARNKKTADRNHCYSVFSLLLITNFPVLTAVWKVCRLFWDI